MPLSKQVFNVPCDPSGKFSTQYPIFLASTGIPLPEYAKTMEHCSEILNKFHRKVRFLLMVYFTVFLITIGILIALLFVLIGIPLMFVVPFVILMVMYLHFSRLEKDVKRELFEFLEQENSEKYISRGVQFMLLIKPPFRGRGFDTYEIQVTLMSGYSQSNLQTPMMMILQAQQQKMYQNEETELSDMQIPKIPLAQTFKPFDPKTSVSSLSMGPYNPQGYL